VAHYGGCTQWLAATVVGGSTATNSCWRAGLCAEKGYPFCSITGTVIISSAPAAWIPQVFLELFFVEYVHRFLWHAVPRLDKWSFLRLLMRLVAYRWLQPSVF